MYYLFIREIVVGMSKKMILNCTLKFLHRNFNYINLSNILPNTNTSHALYICQIHT